jgi:protein YibB
VTGCRGDLKTAAIVTAFSDIGRGSWEGWAKRTTEQYIDYFKNIANLKNPMYMYVDDNLKDVVLNLRKDNITHFIDVDIYNKYKGLHANIKKVHSLDSFKASIPNNLKNNPEYWNDKYVFIMLLKSYFVKLAIEQFDISEDLLVWLDFGYVRHPIIEEYLLLPFNADKVTVFSQKNIGDPNITSAVLNNEIFIMGGSVTASKENWLLLNELCEESIKELVGKNLIDDDQGVWLMAYTKNRDLFEVIITENNWFPLFDGY